jgi:hypothetical protein
VELRFVTDFLELPRDRAEAFRGEVRGRWRYLGAIERRRQAAIAELRAVAPSHEDVGEPYLGSGISYLEEQGVLTTGWDEHGELLMDLVEMVGGGWDLIEPRPGLAEALDPAALDEMALQRHFEELDGRPAPDAPAKMLAGLEVLRNAVSELREGCVLLLRRR